MLHRYSDSIVDTAVKVAPPITVSAAPLFQIGIPEVVQILTGIYLIVIIGDKVYSLWKRWRNGESPK